MSPLPAPAEAVFFDGRSASRQVITVSATSDGRGIVLGGVSATPLIWPLDRLRQIGRGDRLTLALHEPGEDEGQRDAARLVLGQSALADWIEAHAPDLRRRDLARGSLGRIALRVGGAVLAFVLILLVLLPRISDQLALAMPIEREIAFGKSVERQMETMLDEAGTGLRCANPDGLAALERLRQRLTRGQGLTYDLALTVFDHPMVNAFAAPGGRIVILRGFLDQAESAEEVAGVLAHEIGHVEARDPVRLAFRAAGSAGILSLVLGDATGGTLIAVLGNHMLSASYTREAEMAADAFAHDLLARAGIGTAGLADFFERLATEGLEIPDYLSTHPASRGRADAARAAGKATVPGVPVLTDAEWQALRRICS